MKTLFVVTAALEVGAGLVLIVAPSWAVSLLFGAGLETLAAPTVARVAGVALLALGLACWLARRDDQSEAATALLWGMSLYNTAATGLLAYAGMGLGLVGIALWPGVALHVAMTGWCAACVRGNATKARVL